MKDEIKEVVERYDELGEGEFNRFDREGTRGKLTYQVELKELLSVTEPGDVVLDVGGGGGKFALPLAKSGRVVYLVDISRGQCQVAKRRACKQGLEERLSVIRGDLRSLPLASDSVSVVICLGGALSHILNDVEEGISELSRVSQSGAVAVTSVMNRSMSHKDLPHLLDQVEEDLETRLSTLATKKQQQYDKYENTIGPFYKYSCDEITNLLEKYDFVSQRTRSIDRHSIFLEPLLSEAWKDNEVREAIIEYEFSISELPWFQDTGNMCLHVSKVGD